MHSKYSMRVYMIVLYIYVYIYIYMYIYISIIYTYRCAWQKPFCDRHILDQNWETVLGKAGCPSDPRSWEIQSCEFFNHWSWPQTTTVVLWDGKPRNFMTRIHEDKSKHEPFSWFSSWCFPNVSISILRILAMICSQYPKYICMNHRMYNKYINMIWTVNIYAI